MVIPFTWAFHALVLHAWWLASGTSGSRTSRKGLLAYCQGASDSLPHPSPGSEVEASVFGIAVRMLLQAKPLTRCMESSPGRARDCPSLPLRVAALSLKLSRSEVPGPHVLLCYYVARVISRGPGVLSSFLSPFLGCLSGSSELDWGSSGHTKSVFLVLKALFILASASAGLIGVFHAVFSWLSFQGLGWCVLFFCPGLRGEDSGALLPCSSVCELHCTVPTKHETIAVGDCYILCGRSGVAWSAWAAHRQRCERFLFAAGCSTKELTKTTVSFWLRMPLSWVCRLSVTGRSVLCPLSLVHSCCCSVSSLRRTLLSSWWEDEDVALALILARLLPRGSCPSVPRSLLPVLCGGGAGPGFSDSSGYLSG